MSKIINLLEQMGCDSGLQTANGFAAAVEAAELPAATKQALLERNASQLVREMDANPDAKGLILASDDYAAFIWLPPKI